MWFFVPRINLTTSPFIRRRAELIFRSGSCSSLFLYSVWERHGYAHDGSAENLQVTVQGLMTGRFAGWYILEGLREL
jgi:hypothetical protein